MPQNDAGNYASATVGRNLFELKAEFQELFSMKVLILQMDPRAAALLLW
jgi:hypothetical protein